MHDQQQPTWTIEGGDDLTDAAIEALARLLLDSMERDDANIDDSDNGNAVRGHVINLDVAAAG